MYWKAKDRPKVQERRVKTKFLLFPKTLEASDGDKYTRWLEFADIVQVYRAFQCSQTGLLYCQWKNMEWNDL